MRIKKTAKIHKCTKKALNMSEGPNENCEFHEKYEKYDDSENFQRSQRDPKRITKTAKNC